jgi:hypothetical protein
MVKDAGYHSAVMRRTFDVYDHVDDWHYMGLHDWLKQQKHGYGRVLDQATREIRYGRITRLQGKSLVSRYRCQPPQYVDIFLDWLGIAQSALEFVISRVSGFRAPVPGSFNDIGLCDHMDQIGFSANDKLEMSSPARHVVVGKGYP